MPALKRREKVHQVKILRNSFQSKKAFKASNLKKCNLRQEAVKEMIRTITLNSSLRITKTKKLKLLRHNQTTKKSSLMDSVSR